MRSTTFSRPLHQVVAAIVALAMGVSLVAVGMAPSALANTSAEVNTLFQSSDVRIIIGGNTQSVSAGLFRLNIGGENAAAFCIDAVTSIGNLPVTFGETDFSSAITDPVKRKQILQILAHYGPNGPGGYTGAARGPVGHTISGNPGEMAAAVQAAIWHFSDGATLLNTSPTSSAEYAMYTTIVNAVKAPGNPLGDPSAPTVSLDILEPGVTEAPAGELVGPYTISSTAASVTVTKGAGVTLHNSDGSEITKTTFANGETFYLKRASQGSGEVTASANAEVKAGRAFVYKNPNERQKIILATNAIVTVTDKATAKWNKPIRHSAKVWKDINGGSAPQGGFQFTLTGGDLQAPITGNVSTDGGFAWMGQSVLTPGTYTMTETEVAGWQQRALGCDAPATGVQVNGRSVTFTIPSAHQSTKVECHFENNKLFDISIKKLVDNAQGTWADAGFDPATDTFTVAYSCTKPQQPAITGQVELKHNESKTVSGIPYGYSCGITGEPALPTLADGFAWNAPTLPDNVVVKGSGKTLTVKNKFSDNRVKFTVTKALVDLPGSGLEGDETFPVTVTCAKAGSADIVYTFDLAADGTWTSGELPTGFSCQIAEGDLPELNDGFEWQTPAISPNPVVTGQHNSATITNKVNDERVSFTVKKVLVNKADSGVDNSTTFDIDVTCTKGDDTETFEVELSHNGVWESPKLPAGYTCVAAEETLPELNDGFEWATPSVAPASITTGQGSEIVVTNTVEDPRVKLTVSKAFANAAGSGVDDDQVFEIDVECTKAGFATYEWTIDLSDGESWESPKLPAGYECVVTETIPAELEALLNDGFGFADPSFVPSNGTVTTARENVSVQVNNKVDERGSITVTKRVEGDTVTTDETVTPWVQDVVISLECDDDQDLELTLEPGAEAGTLVSTDVLDVAAGTTCVVTEVSDGVTAAGAVEITIAGVAVVEGTPSSPITVGAGEQLVIEVVNTYSGTEVEGETITPTTPTTKPTQVAGVQLPRTGAGLTQQLMVLAGALLVLGGFALALGAAKPRRQEV